ncbi:methyltransferase family protein [Saccharomonospora xinjiangensis]|uniref:methyltransferase family protein n=1 Tax=Saccharomonospora xinjiangensis TaxID=75294 RepID=UPI000A036E1A|nr:hypothetical protein [Saccharomonospora xinjiangensis]
MSSEVAALDHAGVHVAGFVLTMAGIIATSAGLTLLSGDPVTLVAFVLLMTAVEIQVRAVEEPYLPHAHGSAYRDYAARVGRFLPGIGCGRS